MTISGHFFGNCMNIFHKTEVQTIILRCIMGLTLIWCKSYDTKRKMQKTHTSANSPKCDKWPFYNRFWPFFCQLYEHLHKTEIQTVILRCSTSLKLNWYKSYDTKCKNAKNVKESFFTKSQKTGNGNICFLYHNF